MTGYQALANGIIEQAVKDYRAALKAHLIGEHKENSRRRKENQNEQYPTKANGYQHTTV
jgi:hypothetical protein